MLGSSGIRIDLPKDQFYLGDLISGTIFLELDRSIGARNLRIALNCTLRSLKRETLLFQEVKILDDSKQFEGGIRIYPFTISIPDLRKVDKLEQGFALLKLSDDEIYDLVNWTLIASLDIPNSPDLTVVKSISIRASA
ncbi:hypothetical protein HY990_07430 [Candidatus Micrarchaeota archaeon]|nr:hypothetical protein [Candidatus Micrarchaeota archaeon]